MLFHSPAAVQCQCWQKQWSRKTAEIESPERAHDSSKYTDHVASRGCALSWLSNHGRAVWNSADWICHMWTDRPGKRILLEANTLQPCADDSASSLWPAGRATED